MKETKTEILKTAINIFFLSIIFFIPFYAESYFIVEKSNKSDSLMIYDIDAVSYVDLNILSSVTGSVSNFRKTAEEFRIETNFGYAILNLNSPYYKSGGNTFKMPHAPVYYKELLLFPVDAVEGVFSKFLPKSTLYDKSRLIVKQKTYLNSTSVDDASFSFIFSDNIEFTYEIGERDILLFLKNCDIDANKFRIKNSKGLIRILEPSIDNDESTVILTYSPEFIFDNVKIDKNILTLLFLKREKTDTLNNVGSIKTIIIDPGHGGKDPGAIGATGLKEKTMTLDIALRLKKLLNASYKNLNIIMTRDKDEFVSLKERTQLANKYPNALFVSIHCNASKNKKAQGFETYFLSNAKTDWERAVEARENSSLVFDLPESEKKGLEFILWDLAQNEFLNESSRLAEFVQTEYELKYKSDTRGLKQAGFYVLKGNYMPAILVESSFISNKEEEKKLKSKDFRQEIAQMVFNGLKKYVKEYEKKVAK